MFSHDALRRQEDSREKTPGPASSAEDLCVLALLAQSEELIAKEANPLELSPTTAARLESLAGPRPAGYWSSVLRCALVLDLLSCTVTRWSVVNPDAEMLGATQSECFPALMAVWMSNAEWMCEVLEASGLQPLSSPAPQLAMALLQSMQIDLFHASCTRSSGHACAKK